MLLPNTPILLFGMPVGGEWFVIAFIALLLFGTRLPSVARSMGRGISEFKRGLKDDPLDDDDDDDDRQDRLRSPKEGASFKQDDVVSQRRSD